MKLDCGHEPSEHLSITPGYGKTADGRKICYACCAEEDKKQMRETGKAILYLVPKWIDSPMFGKPGRAMLTKCELTNWPGSLKIPCLVSFHRHNIAGRQYSVQFTFEGQKWHGRKYGDNTDICHCKRNKVQG